MRIRAQGKHLRHLRAVVISAYSDERTMKAASEADAHFLPKLVDFALLNFVREIG